MGPLNDENKLQVDKKNNKNWKIENSLKVTKIITLRLFATNWLLRTTSVIQSWITNWWDQSAFYGYLKKKRQKEPIQKKFSKKASNVEVEKKWTFQYKFFYFQIIV